MLQSNVRILVLDASIIPLCLDVFDWSICRRPNGVIKLHAVLDYEGCLPMFVQHTESCVHEIKVAHSISFPKSR